MKAVMDARDSESRVKIPAEPFQFVTDDRNEYFHGDCRKLVAGYLQMTREQQHAACLERDQNASIIHAAGQIYVMTQAHHHIFQTSGFSILSSGFAARDSSFWFDPGLPNRACNRHDARTTAEMAVPYTGI